MIGLRCGAHRALQADRTDCEHERIEGELTMIEAPFGSASPIWPVAPIPGFALQTPLQTPMSFANAALGATTLGSSGLNPITSPGLNVSPSFAFGGSPQLAFANPEPVMAV